MKHCLILMAVFTVQLFQISAQANLLPPRLTYYTSSSLVVADSPERRLFRVDRTSLNIQCDRNDCTVEAKYSIASGQPSETVLFFVLPRPVKVQAAVNGTSVPVSMTSALDPAPSPVERKSPFLTMRFEHLSLSPPDRFRALYYAAFPASFSTGKNSILVHYEQPYNRDLRQYRNRTIQQLRYELWPLANWYLADTFTMTLSAEFTETVPGEDELLVHYYNDSMVSTFLVPFGGYGSSVSISDLETQWKPSSSVERFTSSTSTIHFEKRWKRNFPDRIVWFIGEKAGIEASEGFYLFRYKK